MAVAEGRTSSGKNKQVRVDNDGRLLLSTGGGGSLDATTLDGQSGSYYLDRSNFTGQDQISDVSGLQAALDAKQSISEKGQANGYASLGPDGKVPAAQLDVSVFNYLGSWDASTNTPTLSDATGSNGDLYKVSVAGSQDLGSGTIVFNVGDHVVHDGTAWENFGASESVASVNGLTGVVVLDAGDVGAVNIAGDTMTGDLTFTDSKIRFEVTGGDSNQKHWDIETVQGSPSGLMNFRLLDDSGSNPVNWLSVERAGTTPFKSIFATAMIVTSGSGSDLPTFGLKSANPQLDIWNTGGVTDGKRWNFLADAQGTLTLRAVTDEGSDNTEAIKIERTGMTLDKMTFGTELHMSEKKIINTADGEDPRDVVNKQQLDTKFTIPDGFAASTVLGKNLGGDDSPVPYSQGTTGFNLVMRDIDGQIAGVAPTDPQHVVNLQTLDSRFSDAQRTAIDALTGSSTAADIVNALQAT